MKLKTARRFLDRNAWKIASGNIETPSFWKMVEKTRKVIADFEYKNLSGEERIFNMINY